MAESNFNGGFLENIRQRKMLDTRKSRPTPKMAPVKTGSVQVMISLNSMASCAPGGLF